ncbi:histidine kinase [Paraflavitalea sp. CAU 1676]|uniref:sensor histidine kinase n=1 Tax=Paraflavitalea sp. CAU 1676 TaxID=3032598 RepID=UPI0023DC4B5F|nr:histidine kinase [Paraflavitalea sp. CAU 1676]MDF2190451.1 histidine kinase [Paraflavitalea sp. CAU 1676]
MTSIDINSSENTVAAPGKLRWLQHETVLACMLFIMWAAYCVRPLFFLTDGDIDSIFGVTYRTNGLSFHYATNVLMPQVGAGALLLLSYFAISRVVIPLFCKVSFKEATVGILRKLMAGIVSLLVLAFLLALGVNALTSLAHPWLFNYGHFQTLSLFGYNDRPLTNLWTGTGAAAVSVCIWTMILGIRALLVHYIDRPGASRAYRVLIANQCTLFALLYCVVIVAVGVVWGITYKFMVFFCLFIPPTFLVFMINTYYVFPRKKREDFWELRTVGDLLLFTGLCTFPFFLIRGMDIPHGLFIAFLNCFLTQWVVTIPVSWFLYRERKDRILQLRGVQKELVKSKADLQFLRSQINPHFLFNALNTLYGTALREHAPDAAAGIQQLGDMMRFMLHDNLQDFIPLEREKEYLANYLSLQQLRVQSQPGITIESDITSEICPQVIAPMLLIPFVENAFKHGISLRQPSWVKVSLVCSGSALQFEVRNSMNAHAHGDPEREHSGVGLQNVRERLALIYPGRHQLFIQNNGHEFTVQLSLQP